MNEILFALGILIGYPMLIVATLSIVGVSTYIAMLPIMYLCKKYHKPTIQWQNKSRMTNNEIAVFFILILICPLLAFFYVIFWCPNEENKLINSVPETTT